MIKKETWILNKKEVDSLLDYDDCIKSVEEAFRLYGLGKAMPPGVLGIHTLDGGFHIKAGILDLNTTYFVAKVNSNFPANASRYGLPLIQGLIIVCECETGQLLAVMDSTEITIVRTGAATAIAARYLSLPDATVATICGCGNQGRISLKMLMKVRDIKRAYAFDIDYIKARNFAEELSAETNIPVVVTDRLEDAVQQSQICVTATPSKEPFLKRSSIAPGTFIAAVGADWENKQELEIDLVAAAKIVTDLTDQSAAIGELHHAIEQGFVTRKHVHAELGEIVAGIKQGRASNNEIIIFDSTGMALQDVATASMVYERALKTNTGQQLSFA